MLLILTGMDAHDVQQAKLERDVERLRWSMDDWRAHLWTAEHTQRALLALEAGIRLTDNDENVPYHVDKK